MSINGSEVFAPPSKENTNPQYPFADALRCWGMSESNELPGAARTWWHGFLEAYEPLRPDLYRYCRHLTRSPWDAEDLAQDTLARAFVTLAQMGQSPPNPRAWLFRVASNSWIDRVRRQREEPLSGDVQEASHASDPRNAREAAGTLLAQLSPQERAAVVLKDVFDFSLDETAEALSTTVGAVKAALHRGRGKLVEQPPGEEVRVPAPAVLDAFCQAFNAGDVERLTALLLDTSTVEVVGATTQYGPEAARETVLWGMLFGASRMATADVNGGMDARFMQGIVDASPRVEVRAHRGSWVLIHWYTHRDGDAVRALTRLGLDGDRVAHLRNYFFNPDLIAEVCGELGLPSRSNGYSWYLPTPTTAEAFPACR
jgi:RNA polymerase sigma-70 factor (ECF subfamily)